MKNSNKQRQGILDYIFIRELKRKSLKDNFSTPVTIFYYMGWIFCIVGFGFNIYIMTTAAINNGWHIAITLPIAILLATYIFYSLSIGTFRARKCIRIYKRDMQDGKLDDVTNFKYAKFFSRNAIICLIGSLCIQLFLAPYSAKQTTGTLTPQQKIAHLLQIDSIATARESQATASRDTSLTRLDRQFQAKLKANPEAAVIYAQINQETIIYNKKIKSQQKTINQKTQKSQNPKYSSSMRAAFANDVSWRQRTIVQPLTQSYNNTIKKLEAQIINVTQEERLWHKEQLAIISRNDTTHQVRTLLTQYHKDHINEKEQKAKTNTLITKGAASIFDIIGSLIFMFLGGKVLIDFTENDKYSNQYKPTSKPKQQPKQQPKNQPQNQQKRKSLFNWFKPVIDTAIAQENTQQQPLQQPQANITRQQQALNTTPRFEDLSTAEQERVRKIFEKTRGPIAKIEEEQPNSIPLELDEKTEQLLKKKEQQFASPTPQANHQKDPTHQHIPNVSHNTDTDTHDDTPFDERKSKNSARTNYKRWYDYNELHNQLNQTTVATEKGEIFTLEELKELDTKHKTYTKQQFKEKAEKALNTAQKHFNKLEQHQFQIQPVQGTGRLLINQKLKKAS